MTVVNALNNNNINNNDDEGTKPNGTDYEDGMEMVVPPQHLFSDYVEIAYLGLVICAGLALNISVLKRLLLERRRARRSNKVLSGFLLLKLNLNVSDILLLLIHASGKLGWLITYEWRGGDCLCRLFNLLSMFTLYLSSNIVICIALDRLFTVLTARRMDLGQQKLNLVRFMLTLAWSFSLLFSLPQLFVWTTYNPFKGIMSRAWVQCTDIWSIDRYERQLAEHFDGQQQQHFLSTNGTATAAEENSNKNNNNSANANAIANNNNNITGNGDGITSLVLEPIIQNIYELSHLFLVFYGPLIALVFCYVIISSRLIRFAANNPCNSAHTIKPWANNHGNGPPAVTYTSAERRQLFKRSMARTVPTLRMYNTSKWRRKSQHYNNINNQHNTNMLLHSAPLMDILELSSTKADEPSNGGGGTAPAEDPTTTMLCTSYLLTNQSAPPPHAVTATDVQSQTPASAAAMPQNDGTPISKERGRDEKEQHQSQHNLYQQQQHQQQDQSSLMVNPSLGNSAISLPITLATDHNNSNNTNHWSPSVVAGTVRPSVSSDQVANNGTLAGVPSFFSLCNGAGHYATTTPHVRNSISYCSSIISSTHDLRPNSGQPMTPTTMDRYEKNKKERRRKAQILSLSRIRASFSKRKLRPQLSLPFDDAEVMTNSGQCLSTSSLFGGNGMHQLDHDRRDTLAEGGGHALLANNECEGGQFCCAPIMQWMSVGWKKGRRQMGQQQQQPKARLRAKPSTASSSGERHFADIVDASSVPLTPQPRRPSASTAHSSHYAQNDGGDMPGAQSAQKSPWMSRNHSARSSYSTTISAFIHQQNGTLVSSGKTDRPSRSVPSSGHFLWRHRSRAFRTTLLVILVHILLWSPYNVYALMKHVNERLYQRMNEQANVLKDMQFLITLVNPFLYGFGRSGGGAGAAGRAAAAPVGQQPQKQQGPKKQTRR